MAIFNSYVNLPGGNSGCKARAWMCLDCSKDSTDTKDHPDDLVLPAIQHPSSRPRLEHYNHIQPRYGIMMDYVHMIDDIYIYIIYNIIYILFIYIFIYVLIRVVGLFGQWVPQFYGNFIGNIQ